MKKLENRSLDRGISLLQALAKVESSSLAELFHNTGLPKSTLRRLLGTLLERGLVRRSLLDKRYRCNIMLPASLDNHITEHIDFLKVALPLASKLTNDIQWPSDIHVRDGNCMKIIDSTRPLSPFLMYQMDVDFKVNLFGSATGMALLSHLPVDEVKDIHLQTENDLIWGLRRFGLHFEPYLEELNLTLRRGYGRRLNAYSGERVRDDNQNAIAQAVLKDNIPVGVLALLWPREYMDYPEFTEKYLTRFQQTVNEISVALLSIE